MFKLIFWFSFLATTFVVGEASCPEGSIKWESKCFLFVTEPSKFFIADGDCVNRGGHLASIHDRSTNVFLAQEAPRYITGINVTDFWIGATNIMTANFTWSWMDETPFNFSEWRDFVPPNTQSCGVLNYANGIWIPDYCYRLKPYVCGFDASQKTTTTTTDYTTPSSTTVVSTEPVTVSSTSQSTMQPTSTTPSPAPTDFTSKTSFFPSSSPTTSQQNPSTTDFPPTTNPPQTESTTTPSSVSTEFPTTVPSTSQPSTTTPNPSEIPTPTPSITTNVPPILSSTTTEPTPRTTLPPTNLPSTPPITTTIPLTEPSTIPSVIPTRLSTTAPPTTPPITDSPKPSEIPTVSTQIPPVTTSTPQTASSAIPLTIPTSVPSTNPPSTPTPKPSEVVPTLSTQVSPLTVTPVTSVPSPQPSTSTTTTLGPDTYCGASNTFKNAEGKATCWFYTPQLDWDSAEQFCKDRRAHLASLHDGGDIHTASNLDQKDYTNTFIWIGLHSTDNLTTWEWIDGTAVDYAPWDKDLNRFSACAHLFENTFHSDFYCSDVTIGVCKKEMFIN